MKSTLIGALTAILILSAAAWPQAEPDALAARHKTWLENDAVLIITPGERDVFLKLATDRDRDLFIEEFWRQRDPTPATPANEYRVEHFRRLEFVDRVFTHGKAGRLTERGRMYILLGPPRDVAEDRHGRRPTAGDLDLPGQRGRRSRGRIPDAVLSTRLDAGLRAL